MGGGYEEIGSYGDMAGKNLNPYTGGTMSSLQGQQSNLWSMLSGMNPNTMMQGLGQNATGLSDIASKLMGAYTATSDSAAMAKAKEGVRGALGEYSGANALYSGAAGLGTERAAAIPWLEALTNQSQMQSQLAGGFGQQYLGAAQNQYSTLASLFGNTQSNIAGLSQYSQYEPQYSYKPGFMDYAAPIMGAGLGFALGGPMGAAAGSGLGGMFGGGRKAPTTGSGLLSQDYSGNFGRG